MCACIQLHSVRVCLWNPNETTTKEYIVFCSDDAFHESMIIIIIAYMIIILCERGGWCAISVCSTVFPLADPFDRIENSAVCLVSHAIEAFCMGIGVDAIITYYYDD